MTQQTVIDKLARILMCTPSRAREFGNEVNWLLIQHGHSAIPIDQVFLAASSLDLFSVTADDVVSYLVGLSQPTIYATAVPYTLVSTSGDENTEYQQQEDAEYSCDLQVVDILASQLDAAPIKVPRDADIPVEDQPPVLLAKSDMHRMVLARLLAAKTKEVTYDQIERAMVEVGLDPFTHEETYTWVIEHLEAQGVPVVDSSTIGADNDSATISQADRLEIDKILAQVFGNHKDGGAEFLTAEEQHRLLEVVREGRRATQQLAEKVLDGDIEFNLMSIADAGEKALNELLLRNRRLVASVALKYGKHARHLTIEDLIQEGMIGLMHGIELFDLDAGNRLSTYATWWVRQAISRAVSDQDRTIRLPVHRVEAVSRYQRAVRHFEQDAQRRPTEEEIAVSLNLLSPGVIAEIDASRANGGDLSPGTRLQLSRAVGRVQALQRDLALHPVSLDTPVGGAEGSSLGEFVPDSHFQSPETVALQTALSDEIDSMLDGLSDRERNVIIHRYGLYGNKELTQEALGEQMEVTGESIRQIQAKALRKLRHPLRSRRLRDFIDYTPLQTPAKQGETTVQGENDGHRRDQMSDPQS